MLTSILIIEYSECKRILKSVLNVTCNPYEKAELE